MRLLIFLLLNFIIGFISDIVLNDLSREPLSTIIPSKIIQSLSSYFKKKSIIQAALYAGVTVAIVLIPIIIITRLYFDIYKEKLLFIGLAFVTGYVADILIDNYNLLGSSLKPYYRQAGSGFWGGFAIAFSVSISFMIQEYILPYVNKK